MKLYCSMSKHSWLVVAMTALVLAGMSRTAEAAFLQNTTGLTSPGTALTFDEIVLTPFGPPHNNAGDDPVLTSQYAVFGVNFSGFFYFHDNDDTSFNTQFPLIYSYDPAGPLGVNNNLSIMFSSPVSEAALAVGSIDAPNLTTFQAYLGGVLQDSGTFPTSLGNPDNYYGFTGIVFDELRINTPSAILQADNLQFSVVPEPATLSLLALGGGLLLLRKRRS
jgi:hypothetical protein